MKAEMQNQSAKALILRVRAGSEADFSALLTMYCPLINKLVATYAVDLTREDTEDMRQEALAAFSRATDNFDLSQGEVEFGLYAKICMEHAMTSYLKKLRRQVSVQPLFDSDVTAVAEDPATHMIEQEQEARLLARIKALLSPYEYSVWMLHMSGCRTGDIAKRLQKPPHSIENAVYRIRRKLRVELAQGD